MGGAGSRFLDGQNDGGTGAQKANREETRAGAEASSQFRSETFWISSAPSDSESRE